MLDGTTDKYGLNAWIFDSTNDSTTNYDKVLFSRTKSAADAVATIGKGVFADVKVKIQGGALDGKTAGHARAGRGAHPRPVARPPVPHVRQPRHRDVADLARRAGLHRRLRRVPRADVPDLDRRRLRDPRSRRHERGDVRRAGPLLGHRPPADAQVRDEHLSPGPAARGRPDDRRVPAPVPGPGLDQAAERRGQPGLRRRRPQRRPRRPGRAARGVHPRRPTRRPTRP